MIKEYKALRNTCGVVDYSYRGKIKLTGEDRTSFLHNILTNDIKSLNVGGFCAAALLAAQGRVLAYMNVIIFEGWLLLDVEKDMATITLEQLNKFLITEDVIMTDITSDYAHFSFQGPGSKHLVPNPAFICITPKHNSLESFDLLLPRDLSKRQISSMCEEWKIAIVSDEVSEIVRIEDGYLRHGIDFDETIILTETGLNKVAVSHTKGCYPGQEVIARIDTYDGLQRKIVTLDLDIDQVPESKCEIIFEEEVIGWISSATKSPLTNKVTALGYIKRKYFDQPLRVRVRAKERVLEGNVRN